MSRFTRRQPHTKSIKINTIDLVTVIKPHIIEFKVILEKLGNQPLPLSLT